MERSLEATKRGRPVNGRQGYITLAQRLQPLLKDKKGHGWGLRSVAMGQTVAEGARVIEN